MNRDLTQAEKTTLETLLDAACLDAVLQALSEICAAKADHIQASYDDAVTARTWRSAAGAIGICSTDRHIAAVSR